MFEHVESAPPDPIFGLTEAFKADPNPDKINLGVGVYKDDQGQTPILGVVRSAERRLLADETTKSYLPIDGDPAYGRAVQALMFGTNHDIIAAERAATCHTPGGTGALRVMADYLHQNHPKATVWLSTPTWANHPAIFAAAGVPTKPYPYYDAQSRGLDFAALKTGLAEIPAGDVVLLHGCCHNPTGVDPSVDQWHEIGTILASGRVFVLVDFAYQGFAKGLDEDAAGLRALCQHHQELAICSSFSKNFGLYRERVGALTVVAADKKATGAVMSRIKASVRRNYSNPPAHGGLVVRHVLTDPELTTNWQEELAHMRERINSVRATLADKLDARQARLSAAGNGFITAQKGMFSFSGLTEEQVQRLRDEHAIYAVKSGRINVAGLTPANIDRFVNAVAAVV